MAQLTDQNTPWTFSPTQLMAHTPKWAKAVILTIGSLLISYNGLIKAVPQISAYIPQNITNTINLVMLLVAGIFQMFGIKNPFATTPDSKDVPVDTAGVTLIKK